MAVERMLTQEQIYEQLSKVQFTKENYAKQFYHITEQTWFQEYGKGSVTMLKKITAKVKKGIKHGKYGESGMDTLDESWKRFLKPTKSKGISKKSFENTKAQTQLIHENKTDKKANAKQRRILREAEIMKSHAPSGRNYSKVEAHEGITSKRAIAWRRKEGISEEDV